MNDIRIRYTWRRKSDGHIWQQISPIECIEGKGDRPAVLNHGTYEFWSLVARELWTGEVDKDGKDVFCGDELLIPRSKSFYTGTVVWNKYGWEITPNHSKLIDARSMLLARKSTIVGNIHNPLTLK